MEPSESINVSNDLKLGFLSSSPCPNPDLDQSPSDPNHTLPLHEELRNFDLNEKPELDLEEQKEEEKEEKEEEAEKDGNVDLKETEENEAVKEAKRDSNGEEEEEDKRGESIESNGDENENENEVDKVEEGGGEEGEEEEDEENGSGSGSGSGGGEVENKDERNSIGRRNIYPVRPEAEDCSFYLKTGTCKFGLNCKFNHPRRKKNQAVKEKVKEREEPTERPGQTECKYYLRSGGCKYGKACRFNHTRGKPLVSTILELNFLGLPLRPGEKECPYYMRTGSCKYGANCRFNHPDPTAVGGSDLSSGYGNGGSVTLGASQSSMPSWSSPRALNETAPFVSMIISPKQGVPPQNPEWNGYQAPLYPPERSIRPPPTYVLNNPVTTETNVYTHHQQQIQVEEYPERPGQPECSYFLKTGDCKYKSNCKYHHPKNRTVKAPPCLLSDKGLPLRPDQNICTHYGRYGICKFGPACKFDHPIHSVSSPLTEVDQHPSYDNSVTTEKAEVAGSSGSESESDATIQQPV